MWGFGFLLIVAIYVVSAFFITTRAIAPQFRKFFQALFWLAPFLLAFNFLFHPGFYKFLSLCNSPDRYYVKPIALNYVPPVKSCKLGFEAMLEKKYWGFECTSYEGKYDEYPKKHSIFRFTQIGAWQANGCPQRCTLASPSIWEGECLDICFEKERVYSPSGGIKSQHGSHFLPDGKTKVTISTLYTYQNALVAKHLNYDYYLYGRGFSKILGGASGEAPYISCKKQYGSFNFDFLIEKQPPIR